MIGFIGTLQLQSGMTAHNQWLSMTCSIPSWSTSVLPSAWLTWFRFSKTDTFSAFHWLTIHSWTLNVELPSEFSYEWISWSLSLSLMLWQSASLSWKKALIWGLWPDFCYCQTVAHLLIWGYFQYLEAILSIHSLRACHAVVRRDPLNMENWTCLPLS
jgi:hypothetical protein